MNFWRFLMKFYIFQYSFMLTSFCKSEQMLPIENQDQIPWWNFVENINAIFPEWKIFIQYEVLFWYSGWGLSGSIYHRFWRKYKPDIGNISMLKRKKLARLEFPHNISPYFYTLLVHFCLFKPILAYFGPKWRHFGLKWVITPQAKIIMVRKLWCKLVLLLHTSFGP